MVLNWLEKQHNINLNYQQIEVINHFSGPALVLAVAGAGKTTCICARTANLVIEKKVEPSRIGTLTFSKASAVDMEYRFSKLFAPLIPEAKKVHFSTIHSFCYQILKQHSIQTQSSFHLIEGRSQLNHKNTLLRKIYHYHYHDFMSEDTLEEIDRLIGYAKNHLMTKEEIEKLDTNIEKFSLIYDTYEHYKAKNHLLDFNDLLTKAYLLLLKNRKYREFFSRRFDFWQLDEFQDVSPVQWEIIKLVLKNDKNILCVGDDDQTIYSFRGSSPSIMLGFGEHFSKSKKYYIEENFRCGSEIIRVSKGFIQNNNHRYHKNIFTRNEKREVPEIVVYRNEKEQVEKTIHLISNRLKENKNCSIGILYRKNVSALPIIHGLLALEIPFRVRDQATKVFRHWMVKDILDIIDYAYHPHQEDLLKGIYYRIYGYIKKEQLEQVLNTRSPNQHIIKSILTELDIEEYQVLKLNKLISSLEELKTKKGRNILTHILQSIGYEEFLKRNGSISITSSDHIISVLYQLIEKIEEPLEWRNYLNEIEGEINKFKAAKGHQNITLSSIHSAKGLEYDYVYIIDVTENIIPSLKAEAQISEKNIIDQIEEERRLFYVAMTRARNKVTMSTSSKISNKEQKESFFLDEIKCQLPYAKSLLKTIKKHYDDAMTEREISLDIGSVVFHHKFGEGVVLHKKSDFVVVKFGREEKKISIEYAGKVLRKEKRER